MSEMNRPLVSIITPCYNGERFVKRYFDCILAQTYSPLELIFINDGSTDHTEEIALSYRERLEQKGIRYIYEYQENTGQAAALNRGLKLFTGEYLTWPDSDDVMTPDCIEKKVKFLELNSGYGLCICKSYLVNENEPKKIIGILERVPPVGEDNFFDDLIFIKNVYFTPGGYMVRSDAFLKAIPDREIYAGRGGQNLQMLLPVLRSYKCGYMQEILNYYYESSQSHSHSIVTTVQKAKQIELYEQIILETLYRIDPALNQEYKQKVLHYFGKWLFGIAIDAGDKKAMKKYYIQLKCNGKVSLKERLLYLKKCL